MSLYSLRGIGLKYSISGLTQLALRLMFVVVALALQKDGLKPNYKQKQCDNIVSPVHIESCLRDLGVTSESLC